MQNFTANITSGQCSKRTLVMTKTHGALRSPGYPRGYAKNQRCTWHISVPRGFRIRLRFRRQFQIQTSAGCTKDRVILAQSKQFRNPLIFCGYNRPNGLLIPRNNLWVRFESDGKGSAKGFFASYIAVGKYFLLFRLNNTLGNDTWSNMENIQLKVKRFIFQDVSVFYEVFSIKFFM